MSRTVPRQKPGRSETVVVTPSDFMDALKSKLGIREFYIDLAADEDNTQGRYYFDKESNSLEQDWYESEGWLWCNPPYDNIRPWVRKADREIGFYRTTERQPSLAMLVPASVGSNWWKDHVHECCNVIFLNGRIKFVGHTAGYPKDLALLLYGTGHQYYDIWSWKNGTLGTDLAEFNEGEN